jgi:hypothetical protein
MKLGAMSQQDTKHETVTEQSIGNMILLGLGGQWHVGVTSPCVLGG